MEDGAGTVDGSNLGEQNSTGHEVLDSRVEKTACSKDSEGGRSNNLVGAEVKDSKEDGMKNLDDGDVFEEAVEADMPKTDSLESVDKIGDLDGYTDNNDTHAGHVTEQFEEAIGVPCEVQNHDDELLVDTEEKGGGLVSTEDVDHAALVEATGEETSLERVGRDKFRSDYPDNDDMHAGHVTEQFEEAIGVPCEVQKHEDELLVDSEEKGGDLASTEAVDHAAMVETIEEKITLERDERDELNGSNNNGFIDNGVDEVKVREISCPGAISESKTLNREDEANITTEDGIQDNVNLNEAVVNKSCVNGDADSLGKPVHEGSEMKCYSEMEGGHTDSRQDIAFDDGILQPKESNKLETETSGIVDTGHHEYHYGKLEDSSAVHFDDQANEVEELNYSGLDLGVVETKEQKVETSAGMNLVQQGDNDEKLNDSSFDSQLEDQNYLSHGQRDTSTEFDKPGKSCKGDGNSDTPVQERIVSTEAGSSYSVEDYVVKKDGHILVSADDLGGENQKNSPFPSQTAGDEVSNPVFERPEKRVAKDEDVKQNVVHSKQKDFQPAAGIPSLMGKSASSTPSPAHPAGLGRAAPLLEPTPRVLQQNRVNGTASSMQTQLVEDPSNGEAEENDETREKLQMIRVKFLRLAHRLGQTPHNVVVAQVLYRLGLAEQLRGRNGGRVAAFSFDRASAMAEQLEAAGNEPLDFSCTIMVLGKTGVGKSATINSIFDEVKFGTDAFWLGTKKVQDVAGTVQGIKVRVIDTPGLLPSWSDQRQNEKILHSVKKFMKKTPPDIVLYLDRLDMQGRDFGDMPLLRTITEIFGPSIWFNAIVVLTHAASAPPEGPNGTATSYDMFVTQRSHVVQQAIRQAAGDMRLMNPVSLVENHSACRTNRAGQRVLPNGQVWKPHLLLLSFASKILAEANTLLKLQDNPPGKPFTTRVRAPPLPFLLSSLLQSRPHVKLPSEQQFGDDDDTLEDELDESSDSDDDSEYDELPPFKRLNQAQLAKLSRTQRKAYNDELEYREKLFMRKQLKEERKRRRMMRQMAAATNDLPSDYGDNTEEESGGAASVPVPMPDLALPASFDADNPTHRYRCLDSINQWLVRPVLEPHGWDHDVGYEGINAERLFVVKECIPISFSGQVTKDKKDNNLQMEVAGSLKHAGGKVTSLGFDMQSIGKDIAYTGRSETRFCNGKKNKATAGFSATLLGDILTAGLKVEDKLIVNKQGLVVASGGAIIGRGDIAYGGSLEVTVRDKDHPLGRFLSTFGFSVMDWHGDLAIGGNAHVQIPVGRHTNLIGRVNLNNRGSGQVSVRLNSSEQLQIALISLVPLLRKLFVMTSQPAPFGQ